MRGKVPFAVRSAWGTGITPAYAGKSFSFFSGSDVFWDHPRLCGEKKVSEPLTLSGAGSPPPMRGKGIGSPARLVLIRITPAYAGKSPLSGM